MVTPRHVSAIVACLVVNAVEIGVVAVLAVLAHVVILTVVG